MSSPSPSTGSAANASAQAASSATTAAASSSASPSLVTVSAPVFTPAEPLRPLLDTANLAAQSILVKEEGVPQGGWVRRNAVLGNKPLDRSNFPNVNTVWDSFARSVQLNPNHRCFGVRSVRARAPTSASSRSSTQSSSRSSTQPSSSAPAEESFGAYEFISYKQVYERVRDVASGLRQLGLQRQHTVGMWAKNCLPWMLVDLAAHANSLVSVAIYDTFGPSVVQYVLNHAELSVVCCAESEQALQLLKASPHCPSLRTVVLFAAQPSAELRAALAEHTNVQLLTLAELETLGKTHPSTLQPPSAADLAVLMYTSGTTDLPKAVMLTHGNMLACAASVQLLVGLQATDVYLSYLPLAHIFEREAMTAFLGVGAAVGFWTGAITRLADDVGALRPTIFTGVPRIFERIMNSVHEKLQTENGFMTRWMFSVAFERKRASQSHEGGLADALVFARTRERLGGRVRLILSGGAPLATATQEFIRVCFCCPVLQGYGLTETCAAGGVSNPRDPMLGQVGAPVSCVEIKLVDAAELGYLVTKNEGEVWIRGPAVSPGYYKNAELTASDFTADGWFKTGDIGRWNASGTLSIIDRKKNIFKLAIGEYVAAERLETIFARTLLLVQIWVYGDSMKNFLVAVAVPNERTLRDRVAQIDAAAATLPLPDLCRHAAASRVTLEDLGRLHKEHRLQSFERIVAVHLRARELSVDEDLVTPTMKLKRGPLKKHFQAELDELYRRGQQQQQQQEAARGRPPAVSGPVPVDAVAVDERLRTAWAQWLGEVDGLSSADLSACATALARYEFAVADAVHLSAFHLGKRPFLFPTAVAKSIVAHAAKQSSAK